MSLAKDALAGPGYGISAKASGAGWTAESRAEWRCVAVGADGGDGFAGGQAVGADGEAGGYCEVLQWVDAGGRVVHRTPEGASLVEMRGLADVGAEP